MIYMHNEIEEHRSSNLLKKYEHDMGYDIRAGQDVDINPGFAKTVYTGLHVCMPPILGMIIKSRSGLAINRGIEASNAGVIDSGYHGAIKIKLYNHSPIIFHAKKGARIAQAVFHIRPEGLVDFSGTGMRRFINEIHIDEWPESSRGDNGIGSSGV